MGVVGRGSLGRAHATEEEVTIMALEDLGGEMNGQLGEHLGEPAFEGGPVHQDGSTYDLSKFILPKKHGGMYGIPGGRPGPMPPDFGNDMATPYPVADVGTVTVPATTTNPLGSFDLSSLLSGNIMGIPTWIILAAAAYFLFFRKGR
jgi:hypothetical protein